MIMSYRRTLGSELRLFTCLMGGPLFGDEKSFFRFRETGTSGIVRRSANASLTKTQSEDDQSQLADKLEEFKQCVTVGNRSYRMKMYESVFVGQGKSVSHHSVYLPQFEKPYS